MWMFVHIFQGDTYKVTVLCIVGKSVDFEWDKSIKYICHRTKVCACVCESHRDASILCQLPSWMVWWGYSTLPTPEPTSQRKFTLPLRISKARKSTWNTKRTFAVYNVQQMWNSYYIACDVKEKSRCNSRASGPFSIG